MRKLFTAVAWVALVAFALFDIALILGAVSPKQHVVTRSITLHKSAQQIWTVLTDYASQPAWRDDLKSVDQLPPRAGQPVWRENYKNNDSMKLVTEQWVPPVYLVRTIDDEKGPVQGSWEFNIDPTRDGTTTVKITERARVRGAFFRFVSRYIIGYGYIDKFLHQLATKMGDAGAKVT
ncbi:MAG TPA: SRPBCC family protein [Terriglobales bacterium]|nr:SRPBCC family protein [Terriglobales bacterium]